MPDYYQYKSNKDKEEWNKRSRPKTDAKDLKID